MKNSRKIYFAGPLFTEGEIKFNAELAEKLRLLGHEVFLPQEHEQQHEPGYVQEIFKSDMAGLDWADTVVGILDQPDIDSGTAFEIGYAYARSKPIYGLRTDFRGFGPDESVNLMVQASLTGRLCRTVSELLDVFTIKTTGGMYEFVQVVY